MVDVDLKMPAAILHEVVSNRSGMPLGGFALYYQSKQLEGEAALSTWGVEKDAVIEVKTRGRGGVTPVTTVVTGDYLATMFSGSASSAARIIEAVKMLATMPLEEIKPQENALRLLALDDGADPTVKTAAKETLALLKLAVEAPNTLKGREDTAAETAADAKAAEAKVATDKEARKAQEAQEAQERREAEEFEDNFTAGMQTRRNDTANKMQELQT